MRGIGGKDRKIKEEERGTMGRSEIDTQGWISAKSQ